MISCSTISQLKFHFVAAMLYAGLLLLFTACGSESFTQQEDTQKKKGELTLIFNEEENGNDVHYKVNFKDGKIISIYKNNEKIPEDEIENYENLVDEQLNSISDDDFYFHPKPHVYHFDMKEFKENMNDWKEKLKADQFKFRFDNEKFKADMENLKEEFKDMDEIVIKIDKDKIKSDLEEGLKNLNELRIQKFDFDFDVDELNENMKRITIEIEKNKDEFELNMEGLEEEMKELDKEMQDLSKEMEELDKEMKILDEFMNEVQSELVKDGFIKSEDEEFELELSKDEMEVNGEKVTDELLKKYKALYKENFGKEIKGKMRFQY